MRAEYLFEIAEVTQNEKVRVAALHLESKALQWHQGYVGLKGERAYEDWKEYTKVIVARFGAQVYEEPLADLRNLRQVSSLKSYMDEFDELCPRKGIREDQAWSFLLSGLIDELQMPVRMFKLKTLADAYALAKLQERTVLAIHSKAKPLSVHSQGSVVAYGSLTRPLSITTSSYKPSPVAGRDNQKASFCSFRSQGIRTRAKIWKKEEQKGCASGVMRSILHSIDVQKG